MRSSKCIDIGNVNWKTNEQDLIKLFSKCGKINRLFVNHSKDLFASTAFIEFENEQSSNKAIREFNGYSLNGQMLTISMHLKQTKEDKKRIRRWYIEQKEQAQQDAKQNRLDKKAKHKAKLKRKKLRRMMRKQGQIQ